MGRSKTSDSRRQDSSPRHTRASVMKTLRELGTAQNVKVYRRHGCGENVYGVSFAHLRKLARQLGCDHQLAIELWDTENSDARSLAMMLADPQQVTVAEANAWCQSVTYPLHAAELAGVVAKSPIAGSRIRVWCRRQAELVRAAGYALVAAVCRYAPDQLTDEQCLESIASVRQQIHESPNRARHHMALAVIAIATTRPHLAGVALSAGEEIGKVEVDHGETSCQTPQITATIQKMLRQQQRTTPRHLC